MENQTEDLLLELGLPFHTGLLYLYLVKAGPTSEVSLLRSLGVELDDFAESLNWLIEQGYVYEEMDESGELFYIAFDPLIVSRSLFDTFMWLKTRFHVVFESDIDSLPPIEKEKILSYKRKCENFAKKLSCYYRDRGKGSGMSYVRDEKQLGAVLSEAIMKASTSIFGITVSRWTPNVPLIWESLKTRMAAGVAYRRISDELTFISFGYRINKRDVEELGVNLRIVERARIQQKFYIIDDRTAIVFWGSMPGEFQFEATVIDNKGLIRRFMHKADDMWNSGLPASVALSYMKDLRPQFLQRASEIAGNDEAVKIAREIFDFGVFSTFRGSPLSNSERDKVITQFCEHGLLMKLKEENYAYGNMHNYTSIVAVANMEAEFLQLIRSQGAKWPEVAFRT